MDWMKILTAVLLVGMIVYLWPRAKHMWANSPKASSDDWKSLVVPLVGLILFIVLLIQIV